MSVLLSGIVTACGLALVALAVVDYLLPWPEWAGDAL